MNALLAPARQPVSATSRARAACKPEPRLALLGSGTVGQAFVARHEALRAAGLALPPLCLLANSRGSRDAGDDPTWALASVVALPRSEEAAMPDLDALTDGDVVVDATASDDVAARHAQWLARGLHV